MHMETGRGLAKYMGLVFIKQYTVRLPMGESKWQKELKKIRLFT